MRSYRTLIVLAVLAALAVPVCTTFGAAKPKAFHVDGVLATADLVFPGSIYDNPITQALDPAVTTGDFVADRLGLPKQVVVQTWLFGLQAGGTYRIFLDRTGITPGNVGTAGGWQLIGSVVADAEGYVNFTWTSEELSLGDYQWAVFVNRVIPGKFNYTELISDNMVFSIN